MVTNYDKIYGETRDALGPPTPIIVDFFDRLSSKGARILDVGCGQGRDALFIARKGYHVVGVDISPNGIRDLKVAADRESLPVEAIVADIARYKPEGMFDVILIDRTLHMLAPATRSAVLRKLLDHVSANGWMLIADEPSNIGDFEADIAAHQFGWTTETRQRGYLFIRRESMNSHTSNH